MTKTILDYKTVPIEFRTGKCSSFQGPNIGQDNNQAVDTDKGIALEYQVDNNLVRFLLDPIGNGAV